jgi:hypothetical protein
MPDLIRSGKCIPTLGLRTVMSNHLTEQDMPCVRSLVFPSITGKSNACRALYISNIFSTKDLICGQQESWFMLNMASNCTGIMD